MIVTKIFITILMTCTPLSIQAQHKVILIIPRQIRRVHHSTSPLPWRQFIHQPITGKATNSLHNELMPSQSYTRPYIQRYHLRSKNHPLSYNRNLPHGEHNFVQGHEEPSHLIVPYGKEISHAISFSKEYVPQKASNHHAGFSSIPHNHHDTAKVSHLTQQTNSYYENDGPHSHHDEDQERRADELALKFLNVKSIGKSVNNYDNEKSPIVSRGISHVTIGDSKTGIIVRDTIDFNDYNKQISQLTNTWPKPLHLPTAGILSAGVRSDNVIPDFNGDSQLLISHPLDHNNFPEHAQFSPSFNDANSYRHDGYAVKEDVEDVPQNFRTLAIQTAPVQTTIHQQQLPSVTVQSSPNNNVFGHSHALTSNIQSQPQALPGYYALTGFTGILHT